LAISKQQKEELVELYKKWVAESDGLVLANYRNMSVKDITDLRNEIRDIGGEFHVIKNTLAKRAFEESGREFKEGVFLGPTALGVSYENPTGLAKILKKVSTENGTIEIKSGYLADRLMTVEEVIAMADLPSMAEMRAKLLSTILAPASKLVRTLAEPGRSLAAVLKARSEQEISA
jgi:large subunit ribosomal protein L10